MHRLILFDIDGTLISTRGIAKETFAEVLEEVYGMPTIARAHDFAGKTDLQIVYEVMTLSGLEESEVEPKLQVAFALIFERMRPRLTRETVHVHPGVVDLLEALRADEECLLGLLTGNMETGAKLKLRPVGLDRFFPLGAYGSDARKRSDLPAIAVERARRETGRRFRGKEIVIIGDTPHDISCGAHLNVKSIAVATGGADHETLASCHPDALFHSLSETELVLNAIRE